VHPHPNTTFPWHLDGMNAQLLRKRLAPDMMDWVAKGLKAGKALNPPTSPLTSIEAHDSNAMALDFNEPVEVMSAIEWAELWDFAAPEATSIAKKVFPELRAEGEDDEYDEDEDEGDEDAIMSGRDEREKPPEPMPLDDILRLMSSGAVVGEVPRRMSIGFAQRS
jgi:hypothetical protein